MNRMPIDKLILISITIQDYDPNVVNKDTITSVSNYIK